MFQQFIFFSFAYFYFFKFVFLLITSLILKIKENIRIYHYTTAILILTITYFWFQKIKKIIFLNFLLSKQFNFFNQNYLCLFFRLIKQFALNTIFCKNYLLLFGFIYLLLFNLYKHSNNNRFPIIKIFYVKLFLHFYISIYFIFFLISFFIFEERKFQYHSFLFKI